MLGQSPAAMRREILQGIGQTQLVHGLGTHHQVSVITEKLLNTELNFEIQLHNFEITNYTLFFKMLSVFHSPW